MGNIKKAIQIEKEYLKIKLNSNKIPFNLIDEIKKCGYDSLEEYSKEKEKYRFSQLQFEIFERSPKECLTAAWRMINGKVTGALIMETEETTVYVNTSKPYNKEYCMENNITVYELPTIGGTIVSNVGDFAIDLCMPENIVSTEFILKSIKNILNKYFDNVDIIDNDILIDGKKVCGTTHFKANGMILFVIFFSFTDNRELIDIICHQNSSPEKTPSYIEDIDMNILKEEVLKWLHVQ